MVVGEDDQILPTPGGELRKKVLQMSLILALSATLGVPEVLGGPPGTRFGPNCHRLVRLGWNYGYHTLWPRIGPLLGHQGPQKGIFGL